MPNMDRMEQNMMEVMFQYLPHMDFNSGIGVAGSRLQVLTRNHYSKGLL